MKGRKPQQLKIVGGKVHEKETVKVQCAADAELDNCPAHLGGYGREAWRDLAPKLKDAGILATIDLKTLESYCIAYECMRHAHARIQQDGLILDHPSRGRIVNPAIGILKAAQSELFHCNALYFQEYIGSLEQITECLMGTRSSDDQSCVRSRVRTRTHGSVGRRRLRPPLIRYFLLSAECTG